ncbi:MAG TPA: hypothetical protein VLV32_00205 [Burkholderiales bacterium]|nr:hypothetical protein [Burkholderiales bacterium]
MRDNPINTTSSIIIASVSAIILCIMGIVAITDQIWLVNARTSDPAVSSNDESHQKPRITSLILEKLASARKAALSRSCANCGVVALITEIDGVDKRPNKPVIRRVELRMDDGTYQVISLRDQSVFHVDDRVKIINGEIVQLGKANKLDRDGLLAAMLAILSHRNY